MKFNVIVGIIAIQEETPVYVIPRSNFNTGKENSAYLIGIPCKVVSEPRTVFERNAILGNRYVKVHNVVSLVSGIQYTIPTGWEDEFDSLEEMNEVASVPGYENPDPRNLIGKKFWPKDNSNITDTYGEAADLYKKECVIVSTPFKDSVKFFGKDLTKTFIFVCHDCKIYRVPFNEWSLSEPLPDFDDIF